MFRKIILVAIFGLTCGIAFAEAKVSESSYDELRDINLKLLAKLSDSVAEVNYFLAPDDKGERNEFSFSYLCPHCNEIHHRRTTSLLKEERPLTITAFAISEQDFIVPDNGMLPHYLKSVSIKFKGVDYPAEIHAYYPERAAISIRAKAPLPGVKPLSFNAELKGRKYEFFVVKDEGVAGVRPYAGGKIFCSLYNGKSYLATPANVLLTNEDGEVAALSVNSVLELSDSLFTPPEQWTSVPVGEYVKAIDELATNIRANIYPVRITLESQRRKRSVFDSYSSDEEDKTEFNCVGFKLADGRLLINQLLNPSENSRIKKISLFKDGKEITLENVGILPNFGGIIAKYPQTLGEGWIELSKRPVGDFIHTRIFAANITGFDRKIDIQVMPIRPGKLKIGWRGIATASDLAYEFDGALFLPNGELLALGLYRRGFKERYGNGDKFLLPAVNLLDELNNQELVGRSGGNVEYAWIGVEIQQLNEALAKVKKASRLTSNGSKGVIVNYVYPESPAAKSGIQDGDIIVSLQYGGNQRVLDSYEYAEHHGMEFPWAHLDQLPEQYFDQLPQPWPNTRGGINSLLNQIGVGKSVTAHLVRNGELINVDITIAAEPDSFQTAKRYQATEIGLTLCNVTYEVAKYLQLPSDGGGVVVAEVRPGSPTSIAGIKPFELIVEINGEQVKSIDDFREKIDNQRELRFTVRRLGVSRVVNLTLGNGAK